MRGKVGFCEFVSRLVASVERLSPTVFVLCFCAGKRLRTAVLLWDTNLSRNTTNENLSVATLPEVEDARRADMLDYYWRKGIPSIVLAIVTVLLASYSYWFVQPNIKQRYRDICARNFLLIEGNIPDTKKKDTIKSKTRETKQPWQVETEDSDAANAASKRGSEERRRLLEQTQLCLRRLTIWDKSDDSVRYQSAQIANHLADWYLDRARVLPLAEKDKDEIGRLLSRSMAERKKAADAIRAVQKLNGKFAFKAYLWTTRQRLHDNLDLPSSELDAIAKQISDLLATEENNAEVVKSDAYAMLAEVFVRQSLLVSRLAAVDGPTGMQPLVLPFFETAQNASVRDLAWAAEAKSISDIEAGQSLATRALQAFWGNADVESSSVEHLVAVFRCLILVNSIKEGQVFVSERIQQVAAFEQNKFRSLTAAACLRQIMLKAVADKSDASDTVSAQACQALFLMSLQLNPESEQILALLEMVSNPSTLNTRSLRLKELMGLVSQSAESRQSDPALDNGLRSLLNASVGLHDGTVSDATLGNLTTAVKATSVHGVVASRLAMRLVESDSIQVEVALRWVSAVIVAAPELLVVWSDRARLHLMAKEYAKAIECYEFMLGKLPGNEQLVEAIDAARSQLKGNSGVVGGVEH